MSAERQREHAGNDHAVAWRFTVSVTVPYGGTTESTLKWDFSFGRLARRHETALNLHKSHSSHKNQQREPLVDAQPAAQHGHREQSCGQDLQLVGHLMETKWENCK